MMWKEFEEIAGYQVDCETYTKVIEPMYTALPDTISKQDFVKMLDKKAFALPTEKELVRKRKEIAGFLFENCGLAAYHEKKEELRRITKQYAKRFYGIDWANDIQAYVYCTEGYAYCGTLMTRGGTFPKELVIGRGNQDIKRIVLVKIPD